MTKRIFITATNTDIGKTYAATKLLTALSRRGLRVGVFKPIETGVETAPPDGSCLQALASELNPDFRFSVEEVVPVRYALPAAPYVASGGKPIDWASIDAALERIESVSDVVIIEGAGGLLVPVEKDVMIIDLIRRFDAAALLISHCALGCINDTLLSLKALEDAGLPHVWALNCRDSDTSFANVSEPYFLERFGSYFELGRDTDAIIDKLLGA